MAEIASWRYGTDTLASARNVLSRLANRVAWVFATGASVPASASRPRRKPPRSVFGEARLRATGARSPSSGTNAPIASLRPMPRPASPSLKPTVEATTPRRVGGLNIDSTWSRSTAALVWRSGTVAPFANVRGERPRPIARYFCPIAPFSLIANVESTGSRPMLLLSFRSSTAIGWPYGARSG